MNAWMDAWGERMDGRMCMLARMVLAVMMLSKVAAMGMVTVMVVAPVLVMLRAIQISVMFTGLVVLPVHVVKVTVVAATIALVITHCG